MITLVASLRGRVITTQTFEQERVRIGRAPDNEVRIDNAALSRHHAAIIRDGRVYTLVDTSERNGVYVNGARIRRRHLNHGDTIGLGKFILTVDLSSRRVAPSAGLRPLEGAGGRTLAVDAPSGAPAPRPLARREIGHLRLDDGAVVPLEEDLLVVGRSSECHLRPRGLFVPRRLAVVLRGHGGFSLVNVARPDLVRLNGAPVDGRVWLRDEDALTFARTEARFRLGVAAAEVLGEGAA
jgi:pSer/pThr/pTyr-binding forkhead associated (FHA) protein